MALDHEADGRANYFNPSVPGFDILRGTIPSKRRAVDSSRCDRIFDPAEAV